MCRRLSVFLSCLVLVFFVAEIEVLFAQASRTLNLPPTAWRINPSSSEITITVGQSINFIIGAHDDDCNLWGAEWYLDGQHKASHPDMSGCDDTDDWQRTFNTEGDYYVEGIVFDHEYAYSAPVGWTVHVEHSNVPPTAWRINPSSSEITITVGQSINFVIGAHDDDCNLWGAEWYLDGQYKATHPDMSGCDDTDNWQQTFNTEGDYYVEGIVFDHEYAYSAPVGWTVHVEHSNVPPTAWRINPSSSEITITVGQSINFVIGAHDDDCNLWGAEWYLDGQYKATHPDMSGCDDTDNWQQTFNTEGDYYVEGIVFDHEYAYSAPVGWTVHVESSTPPTRHMWVWNTADIISDPQATQEFLDFCASPYGNPEKAITMVYLEAFSVTSDPTNQELRDFVQELAQNAIVAHALAGDPAWASNHAEALIFVSRILEYNRRCPNNEQKFSGIHLDVECADQHVDDYMLLLQGLKDHSYNGESMNGQGMVLGVDTRFWWEDNSNHWVTNMLSIPDVDYISVMAYREAAHTFTDPAGTHEGIIEVSEHEVLAANNSHKPCVIGVETADVEPEWITFYEEGNEYMEEQLAIVQAYFESEPSFGGIAIHHFQSYHEWETGIVEDNYKDFGIPTSCLMLQNYPNPAPHGTVIQYSIPKETFVSLSVYNVAGQKVTTLVSEEQKAGRYEVTWGLSTAMDNNLGGGVYFYRLLAGDLVQTKKLVVIR